MKAPLERLHRKTQQCSSLVGCTPSANLGMTVSVSFWFKQTDTDTDILFSKNKNDEPFSFTTVHKNAESRQCYHNNAMAVPHESPWQWEGSAVSVTPTLTPPRTWRSIGRYGKTPSVGRCAVPQGGAVSWQLMTQQCPDTVPP